MKEELSPLITGFVLKRALPCVHISRCLFHQCVCDWVNEWKMILKSTFWTLCNCGYGVLLCRTTNHTGVLDIGGGGSRVLFPRNKLWGFRSLDILVYSRIAFSAVSKPFPNWYQNNPDSISTLRVTGLEDGNLNRMDSRSLGNLYCQTLSYSMKGRPCLDCIVILLQRGNAVTRWRNWRHNSVRASIFLCPSPLCCSVNGQWDDGACGALFSQDRYALMHQQLQVLLKMSAYVQAYI